MNNTYLRESYSELDKHHCPAEKELPFVCLAFWFGGLYTENQTLFFICIYHFVFPLIPCLLIALLPCCLPLQKGIFFFNILYFLLPCLRDICPAYIMYLLMWNFIYFEETSLYFLFYIWIIMVLEICDKHSHRNI